MTFTKTTIAKPRILIVGDDVFVQDLHVLPLVRAGYSVNWARNSTQAMGWLEPDTFTAVISDMMIPQMDGLRLLQAIHQRLPQTPVILISNSVHPDMEELAHAWGATAVLSTPVDPEKLKILVERVHSEGMSLSCPGDVQVSESVCAAH